MALAEAAGSTVVQAKRKTNLEDWDKRRVVELGDDTGSWEVLYCSSGLSFLFFFFCFFFFSSSSLFHFRSTLFPYLDPKRVPPYAPQGGQMRQVGCKKKELKDVHVPLFELSTLWTLSSQPHVKSTTKRRSVEEEEALEDRNHKIGEFFEWLGMACLGSQRFSFSLFFFLRLLQESIICLFV